MNRRLALCLAMVALPVLAAAGVPQNVARGASYTVAPKPNYPGCTDDGDAVQLTDGKHAGSGFWTDKAAVGWMGERLVTVTIDLGAVFDVSDVTFSTAAGKAEVEWPAMILVLGSMDGRSYAELGDLVALDAAAGRAPAAKGFDRHTFTSHRLDGQARFVRLMIAAAGPYVFSDEIEVFGARTETLRPPRDATTNSEALFWQARAASKVRAEVVRRLREARARVPTSGAAATGRASLLERIGAVEAQVARMTTADWKDVSEQYPLNAAHAEAFGIIGGIERASGAPPIAAWPGDPWAVLEMTTPAPHPGSRTLDVSLMNGEVRSAAINVRNSTARALSVTVDLGDVDALEHGLVEARPVAWTGDADAVPVALALLPPAPKRTVTTLEIPAGVTRQVWLTFSPSKLSTGAHAGAVRVSSPGLPDIVLAASVRILAGRFPVAPRLHVGGWDYLHERGAALDAKTLDPAASLLSAFGVDLPWATAAAMPFGDHDREGRLLRPPETTILDAWLSRWPRASRYRVFVSARDDLLGARRGTTQFEAAVRSWSGFWAAHLARRGVDPGQLELLFVDEPRSPDAADRQIAWARALNAAGSGLRVWIDPMYADPDDTPAAIVQSAGTICLNRWLVEQRADAHRRFARRLLAERRVVELYATAGPSSQLDPYSYYRLIAWRAFDLGASAVGFWSFTDIGSGTSWREWDAPRVVYSPLFLDRGSVTAGKHLYAIREGVEDHEYLALLRDAIEERARRRPGDPALASARAVLSSATDRVLASSRPDLYRWRSSKDRTTADVARLAIARELARLSATEP